MRAVYDADHFNKASRGVIYCVFFIVVCSLILTLDLLWIKFKVCLLGEASISS